MKYVSLWCATLALVLGLANGSALAYTHENGVIILRNRTNVPVKIVEIRHMVGSLPGIVIDRDLTVPPHQTVYANRCCYAGGSDYRIAAMADGSDHTVSHVVQVRMRLCKVEGHLDAHYYASFAVEFLKDPRGNLEFVDQGPDCK